MKALTILIFRRSHKDVSIVIFYARQPIKFCFREKMTIETSPCHHNILCRPERVLRVNL